MTFERAHPRFAVGAFVVGIAAVALVALPRGSPLAPPTPPAGSALPPLDLVRRSLSLASVAPGVRSALGVAAIALLTAAYLIALHEAWRGSLSARLVMAVAVISIGVMVLLPVLLSTDLFSYAIYGRILALHHANPYVSVPADFPHDPFLRYINPAWRVVPSAYGPAHLLVQALVALVARTPARAVVAFKAFSGCSAVAASFVLRRLVRALSPQREAFALVLFGWSPILLVHAVAAGHVDPFLSLAMLVALSLVVASSREGVASGRALRLELGACAMLTVAVLFKVTLAPALVLLVVAATARRPAGMRRARFLAHASVAVGILAVGVGPFVSLADPTLGLAKAAVYQGFLAPSGFWAAAIGGLFTGSASSGGVAAVAARIIFPMTFGACLALLAWRLARDGASVDARRLGADQAIAMLILLLASPILFPWYLLWLLPVAWLLVPRGGVPLAATVVLTAVASVSETVPRTGPGMWRSTETIERFVFGPMLTLLLAWVVWDLFERRNRTGVRGRLP